VSSSGVNWLMIQTSWVRFPSQTTWLVTFGMSLYFDHVILWMRCKTKIPCTWVSVSGQAKDPKVACDSYMAKCTRSRIRN
jgi:hypothetical protein